MFWRLSLHPSSGMTDTIDDAAVQFIHTVSSLQDPVSLSENEPVGEQWAESGLHSSYLSHSHSFL